METNSPADEPTPATSPETPAEAAPLTTPAAELSRPAEGGESVESAEPVEAIGAAEARPGDAGAGDELAQLAEASQKARLSPAEEERMGALLREALQGGRAGVARAIEALPKVPWIVGVRAVETVWPELTAGFRTQLLAGLAKDE